MFPVYFDTDKNIASYDGGTRTDYIESVNRIASENHLSPGQALEPRDHTLFSCWQLLPEWLARGARDRLCSYLLTVPTALFLEGSRHVRGV
jgi:hypothetical protein